MWQRKYWVKRVEIVSSRKYTLTHRWIAKIFNELGRDWHIHLHLALWAYQTSFHTAIGATPFLLVYNTEVVLTLEVQVPSFYLTQNTLMLESKAMANQIAFLELLDEKCLTTFQHLQGYQK